MTRILALNVDQLVAAGLWDRRCHFHQFKREWLYPRTAYCSYWLGCIALIDTSTRGQLYSLERPKSVQDTLLKQITSTNRMCGLSLFSSAAVLVNCSRDVHGQCAAGMRIQPHSVLCMCVPRGFPTLVSDCLCMPNHHVSLKILPPNRVDSSMQGLNTMQYVSPSTFPSCMAPPPIVTKLAQSKSYIGEQSRPARTRPPRFRTSIVGTSSYILLAH